MPREEAPLSTTAAARRKSTRRGESPESDVEKRRGRPRVEKQDETPADRRRYQIRMAQRAYRQRKESTLEELRKRVSDLSKTIEVMNKSFLECRDRLSAANLDTEQLMDLQLLSYQFDGHVKVARNPTDDASEPLQPPSEPNVVASERSDSLGDATLVTDWLDKEAVASAAKPKAAREMDVGMGYELSFGESGNLIIASSRPSRRRGRPKRSLPAQRQDVPSMSVSPPHATRPGPSTWPMAQPDLPHTYSFQESSFGRRLARAGLEVAYSTLLDPSRKQADYDRIFRLCLSGRSREKMLAGFKHVMEKSIGEELHLNGPPLIHIGGAGTHYDRYDAFGNLIPKRESSYIGFVGAQVLGLLEDAARQNKSSDMTVEVAGFEGEWFDPYDVQGYLEEKGIFIAPSASFVEAHVDDWHPLSSDHSSMSTSQRSPACDDMTTGTTDSIGPGGFPTAGVLGEFGSAANAADLAQWNEFGNVELGPVGYSDAQMGSWMNFLQPGEGIKAFDPTGGAAAAAASLSPHGTQHSQSEALTVDALRDSAGSTIPAPTPPSYLVKRKAVIDVSKLLDVLLVTGVCLGRTSGFRRHEVDRALRIATVEVC